ncbi:MAG TPA: hypothetical protein VJ349_22930, partial [Stellaceae bacterium]|nr:hypothetical protein [Stellaceae bacterium]
AAGTREVFIKRKNTRNHEHASACNPSAGSSYVSAFLQLYMLPGPVSPKPRKLRRRRPQLRRHRQR